MELPFPRERISGNPPVSNFIYISPEGIGQEVIQRSELIYDVDTITPDLQAKRQVDQLLESLIKGQKFRIQPFIRNEYARGVLALPQRVNMDFTFTYFGIDERIVPPATEYSYYFQIEPNYSNSREEKDFLNFIMREYGLDNIFMTLTNENGLLKMNIPSLSTVDSRFDSDIIRVADYGIGQLENLYVASMWRIETDPIIPSLIIPSGFDFGPEEEPLTQMTTTLGKRQRESDIEENIFNFNPTTPSKVLSQQSKEEYSTQAVSSAINQDPTLAPSLPLSPFPFYENSPSNLLASLLPTEEPVSEFPSSTSYPTNVPSTQLEEENPFGLGLLREEDLLNLTDVPGTEALTGAISEEQPLTTTTTEVDPMERIRLASQAAIQRAQQLSQNWMTRFQYQ